MANNITAGRLRSKFKRQTGQEKIRGVIGDKDGVVYHTDDKTKIRVRIYEASGLSNYKVVRCNASVKLTPGAAVYIGYDLDGEYTITQADYEGQIAQGTNPLINNAADSNINNFTSQGQFTTGLSFAYETGLTEVGVQPWFFFQNGVIRQFNGARVELSSYIPASGLQRLACLFLTPSDTVEVNASTAISLVDVLTIDDDFTECWQGATPGSIPLSAWRLADNQTEVLGTNKWLDLRGVLNIDDGNTSDTDWEVLETAYLIPSGRRKIMSDPKIGSNGTLDIQGTLVLI